MPGLAGGCMFLKLGLLEVVQMEVKFDDCTFMVAHQPQFLAKSEYGVEI